ncbi:MAG: hypothetical protein PGN15_10075 [Aeromicrobium erythreum]
MSRRSRLLASSRNRLAAGGALGVLAQLSSLGLLLTSGWLVVRAAEQPPVLYLIVAVTSVRMFGVARAALRYAERLLTHDAALARGIDHRVRSYEGLARVMPTAGATRRGDVVRTVVADVEALQDGLLRLRLPWVSALVTCAVTVAVVSLVLPAAGVALVGFAATALLAARVLVPRLAGAQDSAPTALSPDVTELVLAAPDLVAYGSARGRDVRAHAAVDALARQDRRRAWAGGLGSLVVLASCAACVLATALLTADAGLTGPLVGVLLLAPVGLVDVLDAVAEAERLRPRVQAARRRLVALEEGRDPMPAPLDGPRRPDGFALDLQDVTLGWDTDLVEHLTGHVPEGARVVVTGPSGSGKSTLAAHAVPVGRCPERHGAAGRRRPARPRPRAGTGRGRLDAAGHRPVRHHGAREPAGRRPPRRRRHAVACARPRPARRHGRLVARRARHRARRGRLARLRRGAAAARPRPHAAGGAPRPRAGRADRAPRRRDRPRPARRRRRPGARAHRRRRVARPGGRRAVPAAGRPAAVAGPTS